MDKSEILEKSRRENRGQDVVGLEAYLSAAKTAWVVMVCLASAICVADAVLLGRACHELLFVICAGSATVFACKYRKLRAKHELFVTVCYAVGAIAFLLAWVARLVQG